MKKYNYGGNMMKIKQNLTQPKDSYSCGAYTLTVILDAFGIIPTSKDITLDYNCRKTNIVNKDKLEIIAEKIYTVAGYMNSEGEYTSSGKNYSPGSSVAYVAEAFGLEVEVNFTEEGLSFINKNFKMEEEKLRNENNCMDIKINALYSPPKKNEVQMLLVKIKDGGLHWIARDGSGKYYDSDNGSYGNEWGDAASLSVGKYDWTGFWMVLKKR